MLFTTATSSRPIADLTRIEVFAECSRRQLREIDQLVTRVDVAPGRVLCHEGELGRQCFAVVEGRAIATIGGRPVGTIEPGEFLGEIALLAAGGRRTAAVTAETRMTLVVLTPSEFASVLEIAPSVARAIARESTRRLVRNADVAPRPTLQRDASGTPGRERILVP